MKTNLRLGQIMVRRGFVTPEQVEAALTFQAEHRGMRVGQTLIHLGFATQTQVMQALAEQFGLPLVHMGQTEVDLNAVALIPQALAQKENLLAVGFAGQALAVITDDPLNYFALEEVRQLTGRELSLRLSETAPLRRAVAYYYAEVAARKATQAANRDFALAAADASERDSGDSEAPIIKLLNSLIDRAISTRASDIHIEPYETLTCVRMRIDGAMADYVTLQPSVHQPLIARIKIMANLDIAERRLPQDGHFRLRAGEESINVRVSVMPTVFGEKAVLRLLAAGQVEDHGEHFGMAEEAYRRFLPMLSVPNGIIYITGPTGSGKSTTLYLVLEHLARRQVNIATIEDPVEKNLPRVNQTQVNAAAGLSFETGLRALLRQDPDIIMVGETRDRETASISVRAAITGHVVLSTLHTNDALSSVVRLTDMGVEPYLLASSLTGVVAQRLVRKVCPRCGTWTDTTAEERAFLGADIRAVRRGGGCQHCSGTGYRGRIAIHEVVSVDRTLRRMIACGADIQDMEAYVRSAQGMRSLKEQGAELVRRGVTTPEELLRTVSCE